MSIWGNNWVLEDYFKDYLTKFISLKIDGSGIVLVHRYNLSHVSGSEGKVEETGLFLTMQNNNHHGCYGFFRVKFHILQLL